MYVTHIIPPKSLSRITEISRKRTTITSPLHFLLRSSSTQHATGWRYHRTPPSLSPMSLCKCTLVNPNYVWQCVEAERTHTVTYHTYIRRPIWRNLQKCKHEKERVTITRYSLIAIVPQRCQKVSWNTVDKPGGDPDLSWVSVMDIGCLGPSQTILPSFGSAPGFPFWESILLLCM